MLSAHDVITNTTRTAHQRRCFWSSWPIVAVSPCIPLRSGPAALDGTPAGTGQPAGGAGGQNHHQSLSWDSVWQGRELPPAFERGQRGRLTDSFLVVYASELAGKGRRMVGINKYV